MRPRSFSTAGMVPVSSSASIFSSSVRPMPGQLGDLALARHGRDRARRLAHRLGGVAVGEHAVHDGAVELVEVGQLVEERGDGGVGRIGHGRWPIRYAALHDRTRLARPAHLQRGREPRDRRGRRPSRAGRGRARGLSRARRRRRLARRHGRHRRRAGRGAPRRGRGPAPARARGPGSRLPGGLRAGALGRRRATCSRWTPTSRTTRRTSRACSPRCATAAPTSRWARATCPAAASPTGAPSGASSAAAARGTHGAPWACRCATSPAASSAFGPRCCARSTWPSVRSRGYAFQVELTYRTIVRGLRVVEVPIVFRDRELGTSKMSWRITAEAAWLVPQLRRGAEHLRHPAGRPQGAPSSRRIDTG